MADLSFMDNIPAVGSALDTRLIDIAKRVGALSAAQDALTHAVKRARDEGASWSDIGAAASMSKQAAHKRWGDG